MKVSKRLVKSTSDFSLQIDKKDITKESLISPGYQQLFKYLGQKDYVQGIFKISGRTQEVENLIKLIENGDEINFNQSDIHAVASSLKYFFKELDPPLLTYDKYDDFLGLLNQLSNLLLVDVFLIFFFFFKIQKMLHHNYKQFYLNYLQVILI